MHDKLLLKVIFWGWGGGGDFHIAQFYFNSQVLTLRQMATRSSRFE